MSSRPNEKAFIVCRQVVKAYRVSRHEIVALRGIDFTMQQGEMVAIIGPSGAGKSSLLNLLGGLDTPTAGQVSLGGQDLQALKGRHLAAYRLKKVGFIWQQVDRNLFAQRSALRNVTLPMLLAGVSPWERRRRAAELLAAVGMEAHRHQHPAQLSGGQQQRVAIAVALANAPQLLLADEPTGSLDRENALQVMELLHDLRQRYGLTVLMVTHDMEMAAYADRVLTLRDGALGQDLTRDDALELDAAGRIQLPEMVRQQLALAPRINLEIRPEGVLLRPEQEEGDFAHLQDEEPPPQRSWLRRLGRRQR